MVLSLRGVLRILKFFVIFMIVNVFLWFIDKIFLRFLFFLGFNFNFLFSIVDVLYFIFDYFVEKN